MILTFKTIKVHTYAFGFNNPSLNPLINHNLTIWTYPKHVTIAGLIIKRKRWHNRTIICMLWSAFMVNHQKFIRFWFINIPTPFIHHLNIFNKTLNMNLSVIMLYNQAATKSNQTETNIHATFHNKISTLLHILIPTMFINVLMWSHNH